MNFIFSFFNYSSPSLPWLDLFQDFYGFVAVMNVIISLISASEYSFLLNRKTTDLGVLTLNHATLLNVFTSSESFLEQYVMSSCTESHHLQIRSLGRLPFQFEFSSLYLLHFSY